MLLFLLRDAPVGAHIEDRVLRLRWERSIPIALPTGAWFCIHQNIPPSDSAMCSLSGGTNGSPRARQRIGDVFGGQWIVQVVYVVVSGSSLAAIYPNPFLSLYSFHPGPCSGINGTKKGLTCFYWSQLQFVHLNYLFVMFTLFRGSGLKS